MSQKVALFDIKQNLNNRQYIMCMVKESYIKFNNISIQMEDNIENNKVKIRVSEIISKCKRKEDWINFTRELGKSFLNFFRFIFP